MGRGCCCWAVRQGLSPAPTWCSFLDSITEELEEESATAVYDNFTFVTRADIDTLELGHLVGSKFLRAYMHGYFIDARLYAEAKAVAAPFAYEQYRKARIERILEEGTARRFELKKAARALPKVNRLLAKKLLHAQDMATESRGGPGSDEDDTEAGPSGVSGMSASNRKNRGKAAAVAAMASAASSGIDSSVNPLGDARFAPLFSNPDFEVDPTSSEYRLLHPVEKQAYSGDMLRDQFTVLSSPEASEESEVEGRPAGDSEADDGSDGDIDSGVVHQPRGAAGAASKAAETGKAPRMMALKEGESLRPGTSLATLAAPRHAKQSFQARLQHASFAAGDVVRSRSRTGEMVVSFKARPSHNRQTMAEPADDAGTDAADAGRREKRRGIKALRLPKQNKQEYWRGQPVAVKK